MHNELLTVLNQLDKEVKNLGISLTQDQAHFIHSQFDAIEQANLTKLQIKNNIDQLIEQINTQSDWRDQIKNKEYASLWNSIIMEVTKNNNIIEVNQKVAQENGAHAQQIYQCIMKACSNSTDVIYDHHAQLDTLK